MSDPRDWEGEMKRIPIDDATAEMLLSGRLAPDDAPPGYAGVAGMIQAATGPAVVAELAHEPAVVAAMRSTPSARPAAPRRKPMRTGLLSAKLAALATTAVLAATGVAVAATGNLPKNAQTTVSDAVAHVGLSIPKPDHAPDADSVARETSDVGHGESASPEGTDPAADVNADAGPNAHSTFGQCTAFLAGPNSHASGHAPSSSNSGKERSTAFAALIANHGGTPASATTFCAGVVAAHHDETTETTEPTVTTEPTETTEHEKSSTSGRPSSPGKSGSHTPGSVADGGGTGTANTASGGASSDGSSNADSHSGDGASHRP